MVRLFLLLFLLARPAAADVLTTVRPVPARTILTPADLTLAPGAANGALEDIGAATGLEARVALYPGRPIRASDLGPPTLIRRNQVVRLNYRRDGLVIITEGRALEDASRGDLVRIMNLSSRNTVTGRVTQTGEVELGQP